AYSCFQGCGPGRLLKVFGNKNRRGMAVQRRKAWTEPGLQILRPFLCNIYLHSIMLGLKSHIMSNVRKIFDRIDITSASEDFPLMVARKLEGHMKLASTVSVPAYRA